MIIMSKSKKFEIFWSCDSDWPKNVFFFVSMTPCPCLAGAAGVLLMPVRVNVTDLRM